MTVLFTIDGCTLFAPMYDCGRTEIVVGVITSLLTGLIRHSAALVSASSCVSGTMCLIVFASRAATRNLMRSVSSVGIEYDMSDSVPLRVINIVCGALFVPAKIRRCSKYDTAPG